MTFWIQASNPRSTCEHDESDESLAEAIETAFPLQTENAIMVWNHISIALGYKYDISAIVHDLTDLLLDLIQNDTGRREIQWPSSTFCAHWKTDWDSEELRIQANWTSVMGDLEDQLNQRSSIHLPRHQFIAEWKEVLERVLKSLRASGYTGKEIAAVDALQHLYDAIPSSGLLYSESDQTDV